jgi:hypothetical protein
MNTLVQFWERVQKTETCWIWTGSLFTATTWYGNYGLKPPEDTPRYGGFFYQGKLWRAHRLSWVIHNGAIPPGKFVLHHCDNPPCVRPDHLFLGTHKDNIHDSIKKNRHGGWYNRV